MTHGGHLASALPLATLVYAVALLVIRRSGVRVRPWFVLAVTVGVQLAGLATPPLTSDDAYRYVWDGRVQTAGIDPYRYVPTDPALQRLRDPLLFPADGHPRLNRPDVPTIYPPAAQAWFAMASWATPARFGTLGVQVAALLAVVATTWLLACRMPGRPLGALVYGACPAVVLEAANGAHLDAVSALMILLVLDAGVRRRHWLAGVWLGLAAAVKLVPLLLVPVFLRRGRWPTAITAVATVGLVYLPHVAVVGGAVAGFLPGYAREEGYAGRSRFALLLFLPPELRLAAAVLVAVGLVALAVHRSTRDPVPVTCCWLYGSSILLATPVYAWYALPLAVLTIAAHRYEWLSVWAASYVAFVGWAHIGVQAAGYGIALVVVVAAQVVRWRASALEGGRSMSEPSVPDRGEHLGPPARHTRSASRRR
jgi:Glycosyltransferase family 87